MRVYLTAVPSVAVLTLFGAGCRSGSAEPPGHGGLGCDEFNT